MHTHINTIHSTVVSGRLSCLTRRVINYVVFSTADKRDDSSKTDEAGTVSGGETEEPPTTYTVKEKYHYFKPRVEVETEEEGNKSHIKEIYIRGELWC